MNNTTAQLTDSTSLDNMIAHLNMMTTDFIFSRHQCRHRAIAIATQLNDICHHSELAFFPEQQVVYFKMLKVWQALAYDVANSETIEQKSVQKNRQDVQEKNRATIH